MKYTVIGLMSGTSLDGLDIAHVNFEYLENEWSFTINECISIPYENDLHNALKDSVECSGVELLILNNSYGQWLGHQVRNFINQNVIEADFIASHGHTVFHQIDKRMTYQIGSGQELANTSGLPVICDFRTRDVSLGGQGAPLVPIGDMLLFGEYEYCLNLGGIANISFDEDGVRRAFDIGPANMLLNYLANEIGKSFDQNGDIARDGAFDKILFEQLNEVEYYSLSTPKTTGYEMFTENIVPLLQLSEASVQDKLHTAVHHVAHQIANHIKPSGKSRMLTTGGGAKNGFLIETMKKYLDANINVEVPEEQIIDFKEALIFAFMGVLRMHGETNCLASVTGAKKDSCSGQLFYP